MGDPSFDLAFCMNHLILKAIHLPASCQQLLVSALTLWQAYQPHINWEHVSKLEARVCQLLPALMLARVDGKSPVEYLDEENQARIRAIAIPFIETPLVTLKDFITALQLNLAQSEPNDA